MREILFRGKSIDNGEWIYGVPVSYGYITRILKPIDGLGELKGFQIKPETVGQYTGLTDRNGTKIFEGDIVKMNSGKKYIGIVEYWEDCFRVINHKIKYFDFVSMAADGFGEVIGNVYDNSEFLEGKENDRNQTETVSVLRWKSKNK